MGYLLTLSVQLVPELVLEVPEDFDALGAAIGQRQLEQARRFVFRLSGGRLAGVDHRRLLRARQDLRIDPLPQGSQQPQGFLTLGPAASMSVRAGGANPASGRPRKNSVRTAPPRA